MLGSMVAMLREARQEGYAVPSFCVWNAESVRTVLDVAETCSSPVILMAGPVELELTSPIHLARIVRDYASDVGVPVVLHLDHGDTPDRVKTCIDAGFNSVMLDYSRRPLAENIAGMREVVEFRNDDIAVEGELGIVGTADTVTPEGGAETSTDPDAALQFVHETGVDSLAVAFGNSHGIYRHEPQFDFTRLCEISRNVGIPLVWHGGSGTSPENLRRGIEAGIAKVNIASEIMHALRTSLVDQWSAQRNLWVPTAMVEALARMNPVVWSWIEKTGSQGRWHG